MGNLDEQRDLPSAQDHQPFFKQHRGEFTAIAFVVAALTFVTLLVDVPQKIITLAREFWPKTSDSVVLTAVYDLQPTIFIKDGKITWDVLVELTNVGSTPISLLDFAVEFKPVKLEGKWWQLRSVKKAFPIRVRLYHTEEAMREARDAIASKEHQGDEERLSKRLSEIVGVTLGFRLPVVLKEHERKYFEFPLELEVATDGQRVDVRTLAEEAVYRRIMALVGLPRESDGGYRCATVKVPMRLTLAPDKAYFKDVPTYVMTVGCKIVLTTDQVKKMMRGQLKVDDAIERSVPLR